MNRGKLIAFEGLDGSGKSTQLALAAEWLRSLGIDIVETREPTDGPWGRKIRAMARSGQRVAPEEELAWFVEDRREHVRDRIEPALAAGRWVLTDRYYLSTVCYQGARGHDPERLLRESEREFPEPDVALVFDLPVEKGLARVAARGGVAEPAFEEAGFLRAVGAQFDALACDYVVRIGADRSVGEIAEDVRKRLAERLGLPASA